jgi:hypothetical protein
MAALKGDWAEASRLVAELQSQAARLSNPSR